MSEALARRRTKERGCPQLARHKTEGMNEQPGPIARFDTKPLAIRRHPPSLGEQTEELLRDLGYSKKERDRLRKQGVTQEGRRLRRFCQDLRRSLGWCVGDNLLRSMLKITQRRL